MEATNQQIIMCPNCASTALSVNKKGFDGRKGGMGMAVVGITGLALGMKDMNELQITCLNCAFTFKPGEGAKSINELEQKKKQIEQNRQAERDKEFFKKVILIGVLIFIGIIMLAVFNSIF